MKENSPPLVFSRIEALAGLLDGEPQVGNSVIDYGDRTTALPVQVRHDKAMEQRARSRRIQLLNIKRKKSWNVNIKNKSSTNANILYYALNKFQIPNFRGIYLQDELTNITKTIECDVINLGHSSTKGSHWAAYYKDKTQKYHLDLHGDVNPPIEPVKYLGKNNLLYNNDIIQGYNDPAIWGHLCMVVLYFLSQRFLFDNVISKLKEN